MYATVCLVLFALTACSQSTPKHVAQPRTTTIASTAVPKGASTTPTSAVSGGPITQRVEASLPVALQEGGAAVVGNDFYEVAGYDVNENSTSYVFRFDGSVWHTAPSLPIALNHPGVAAIGTDLYVAGGFTPNGASARVFVLHAGSSTWQEVAPLRRARGALVLVALDGRLYAFGGRDRSVEIAIPERYEPTTNTWTDLPPMPDPRNHGAGYLDGANACIAGGRIPATTAAIDCVNAESSAWTRVAQLPVATSGASAALFGGRLLVAGGEPSTETHLIDVVQVQQNGAWTTQPMLVPRHGTAYALYNGRLWQCGGASAPGFHAVATCTSTG